MAKMIQEFRSKEVLKLIIEYRKLGLSDAEIADRINKKLKLRNKLEYRTVASLFKQYSIKAKVFLKTDKAVADLYKETLIEVLKDSRGAKGIIQEALIILNDRLAKIKKEIPDQDLMIYMREIGVAVRTVNDSIRTIDKVMERLENQKKEISIKSTFDPKETMRAMKDLVDQGVIEINPEYKEQFEFLEDDR